MRTLVIGAGAGERAGWGMRRRVQGPPRSGDRQPYRARGRTALVAQSSTRHRSGRHDHDGRSSASRIARPAMDCEPLPW
jgi:hypothetical protein